VITRDEHLSMDITPFYHYDNNNIGKNTIGGKIGKSKVKIIKAKDLINDPFFKVNQTLDADLSPNKGPLVRKSHRIDFTLNKLLAGSPGPAN
jgi:hypothetical protein